MTHRFLVRGQASPDLPLRLLNMFAQQDLCFDRVTIDRRAEGYDVQVDQEGLSADKASIILEKMRMMVLVESAVMHAIA
ncbi:hypothetical protein [Sphingomonas endolithica]|uniref:hypothetical protein n=1 Tax=Sphingomonas endolithica TaxID=2972485 RepID=UPI0021AE6AB8|nr:hypothetical protein [Sphingomonas sp. ZFBP2030]